MHERSWKNQIQREVTKERMQRYNHVGQKTSGSNHGGEVMAPAYERRSRGRGEMEGKSLRSHDRRDIARRHHDGNKSWETVTGSGVMEDKLYRRNPGGDVID